MGEAPAQKQTLYRSWNQLSLAAQFVIAGSVVLVVGMAILGSGSDSGSKTA